MVSLRTPTGQGCSDKDVTARWVDMTRSLPG